jgi:hypothetical protein
MQILTAYLHKSNSRRGWGREEGDSGKALARSFRSPLFKNIFCNTCLGQRKIKEKKDTSTKELRMFESPHSKSVVINAGYEVFTKVLIHIQLFWDVSTFQKCVLPRSVQYKDPRISWALNIEAENPSKKIWNSCAPNMEAECIFVICNYLRIGKTHMLENVSLV